MRISDWSSDVCSSDLVVRNAEVVHREHRDAGEGFVDFEKVDIRKLPAYLVHQLGDRADGSGGELGGFLRVGRDADDCGDRLEALGFRYALASQHDSGGDVGDRTERKSDV